MESGGSERYARLCAEHEWEVPERYNIAADVCDARAPDSLAMIHETHDGVLRELPWGELQSLAGRAANLLAGLGVERGDRVAVVLPPTPETAAVFFATWKLGAILLSMSVLYGDEGIAHRLRDSEPVLLVTDAANAPRFQGPWVPRVLVLDGAALAAESEDFQTADTAAEDPAQLYYTSGTTGLAKGIVHAHRYLLAHNEFELCHDVRAGERFHGMGEWAWAAGICPLLGPWRHDAVQLVLQREGGFDAHRQLDFLSRNRASNVFATPTAIRSMMGISDARERYPQSFRVVCSAGEPLNPEAIRWFRSQYDVTVLDYYGLTESSRCAGTCRDGGARGLDGQADAGLAVRDPRRGRAAGARGRARRDMPARAHQPALPARVLAPAEASEESFGGTGSTPGTRRAWTRTATSGTRAARTT